MFSVNLLRKYSGVCLVLVCVLFICKELVEFVRPPCTTLNTYTDIQSVLIKLRSTEDIHPVLPSIPVHEELIEYVAEKEDGEYNISKTSFTRHRIKMWYGGRCVDIADSSDQLEVDHCDPDIEQSFSLTPKGELIYDPTGQCVVIVKDVQLGVGDCEDAVKFKLISESYLQSMVEDTVMCLSPTSKTVKTEAYLYSCLRAPVSLTPCVDDASRIEVLEEDYFQEERKAFAIARVPTNSRVHCDFKACGLNEPAEPVKMLRPIYSTRCTNMFDCVTLLTKTARRPYLVMRLAQSIKDIKGYDLRIISYDDGPNDYPAEVWDALAKYPYIDYIVADEEDIGISKGRNLGLELIKTKYFLLVDDDHVFNNKSNLEKMVDILDTTDATLVGGKFEGFMKFAGALKFGYYHNRQEFAVFSGYCERTLPQFPNCEQCDSTSNIFMAKTQHIKEIKGWSEELKIAEHADFFVKLKAFKKKVVYCDDIEVINQQETAEERSLSYQKLRYDKGRKNRMFRLMNSRYNVNGLFWCSNYTIMEDDTLQCLQTKHKIGYC